VGRPTVTRARVLATVEETSQTEKTLIFKKRRRKDSQRHQGHRQWVTVLRIDKIVHEIKESEITQ
jgi:large subunit ribosomal protein L21